MCQKSANKNSHFLTAYVIIWLLWLSTSILSFKGMKQLHITSDISMVRRRGWLIDQWDYSYTTRFQFKLKLIPVSFTAISSKSFHLWSTHTVLNGKLITRHSSLTSLPKAFPGVSQGIVCVHSNDNRWRVSQTI